MEPIEISKSLKIVDIVYRTDSMFALLMEEEVSKLSFLEPFYAVRFDTRVKNTIDPFSIYDTLSAEVVQKVMAEIKKLRKM